VDDEDIRRQDVPLQAYGDAQTTLEPMADALDGHPGGSRASSLGRIVESTHTPSELRQRLTPSAHRVDRTGVGREEIRRVVDDLHGRH
jgi:hypothetical protein